MEIVKNIVFAIIFLLLVYAIYNIIDYFRKYSDMQKKLQSIYLQMNETEKLRADEERQQMDIHGMGTKKDWLSKLDESLGYSGIKEKFRWLTTEMYLIIVIVIIAAVVTITTIFFGIVQGIIAGIIVEFGIRLVIILLSNARAKRTESQMLQFMNIIDNFSKTSNDLIDILEKTSRYIDEPLSGQIYDAVQEARNSGDSITALRSLQSSVKNRHFKILIQNLETSSRLENNYSDIIEDCRDIFHTYIKAQKEKRAIRMNGMFEILLMTGAGMMSLYLIGGVTEDGNIVSVLLNNGTVGQIILVATVAALLLAIYIAIFKVIKNED